MTQMPVLIHLECHEHNCSLCLQAHIDLGNYLSEQTGTRNEVDHLAKYRTWLEKRLNKTMETEHGWACPEVFEEDNIKAYIVDWQNKIMEIHERKIIGSVMEDK